MIIVDILLLILGFVIIYFSVDYLLDELEEYLETYQISPTVFGILILGMDIEESIASLFGAIEGLPLLSIGNLVGNSIIAISIAFAIPVLLIPFVPEPIPRTYYVVLLGAAVNLFLSLLFPENVWVFGIIALLLFIYVLYFSVRYQLEYENETKNELEVTNSDQDETREIGSLLQHSLIIIVTMGLVIGGGELLVLSAENIIAETTLSESFFGLIIMAFMTNVEEFWLMYKAIKKNQIILGISSQIGKILWNITLIFGLSGVIIQSYAGEAIMVWSGVLFLLIIAILTGSLLKSRLDRSTVISFFIILVVFFGINIGAVL